MCCTANPHMFLSRSAGASGAGVRRCYRPGGYLVYLVEAAGQEPSHPNLPANVGVLTSGCISASATTVAFSHTHSYASGRQRTFACGLSNFVRVDLGKPIFYKNDLKQPYQGPMWTFWPLVGFKLSDGLLKHTTCSWASPEHNSL